MSPSRSGLRLLVACLALTGLLAINAGSAQAEKGAFWTVNGLKLSLFLSPTVEVATPNGETHVEFLGKIGVNKFNITCSIPTIFAFEVQLLEPNGAFSIKFKKFTGCIFKGFKKEKEEELKLCEPHEGTEKGVLSMVPLKGLLTLSSEGTSILSLEPVEGTTLFTVELSEECVYGEKVSFNGKVELKDSEGTFSTEQVVHTLEEDPNSTKLFVNGKEANTAHIDLKLRFFLSGAHRGLTWAGHPA